MTVSPVAEAAAHYEAALNAISLYVLDTGADPALATVGRLASYLKERAELVEWMTKATYPELEAAWRTANLEHPIRAWRELSRMFHTRLSLARAEQAAPKKE